MSYQDRTVAPVSYPFAPALEALFRSTTALAQKAELSELRMKNAEMELERVIVERDCAIAKCVQLEAACAEYSSAFEKWCLGDLGHDKA